MASILQKLLRKSHSPSRTITFSTHHSQSLNQTIPLFIDTKPHHPQINQQHQQPSLSSSETETSTHSQFSQNFPSFPFGFSVNQISSSGFVQSEDENVGSVDCQMKNCAETKTEDLNHSRCSLIYPTFPFGCGLNPIFSSGFLQSEPGNVVSEDSGMIWADSVKKKRKRKMNKHKYKKLKKSLRRKA